ncbi:hypothetical protein PybrP1_013079 [[Pythium] brassicae (nom. inval.)]|nr:hypothetical protein PybrP1_013079 [[Pythium] brassicae (nom. inval.)]
MAKEPPDHRSEWRVPWTPSQPPREYPDVASLVVARNEVAGVQLRLRSNYVFQVVVDSANWLLPCGHAPRARVDAVEAFVPPQLRVELFVVGAVEDENGDRVFETLSRAGASTAAACDHAVYVRLRVASSVLPAVYEIPIRVFTQRAGLVDEQLAWRSCVRVRVADVALPPPRAFRFHLDLWQHLSSIARAHGAALWSDRHFALIENYLSTLSELGQKCVTVVATEMPWVGQQCYLEAANPSALFEHAVLPVYESPPSPSAADRGAGLEIDFQHFDRLLALAGRYNMDAEIEVFGLLSVWCDPANGFGGPVVAAVPAKPSGPRRHRRRRTRNLTDACTGAADERPSGAADDDASRSSAAPRAVDAWRIRCSNRRTGAMRYLRRVSEVEQFLALFYEHCVAMGVADRVRVCADEPSEPRVFCEQLQFLQQHAPGFRVKLALNSLEFLRFAPPQVVDYVPLLPLVCADLEATRRLKAQLRDERGGRLCWYVCCHPRFPNQFVSSPLVEGELVGYLTFFLELDGFLRWNYCLWPAQPWANLRWRTPAWRVGDMYFVLPGLDGFPVETLRFEALRFAVQAYELLRLAQDALSPVALAQLKDEVAQLIWRTTDFAQFCQCDDKSASDLYSLDPMDFQRARALIIDTLAVAGLSSPGDGSGSEQSPGGSPRRYDDGQEDVR